MQEQLLGKMNAIAEHRVFSNDYFKLLKEIKLTPTLFELHRANFLPDDGLTGSDSRMPFTQQLQALRRN